MNQCKTCGCETNNKMYCSNLCKTTNPDWRLSRKRKHRLDQNHKLQCNHCNWSTFDVHGLGGHPARHLREKHNIFDDEYITHFNIIQKPIHETMKCPYCEWHTVDIQNKSGQFTSHLKRKHGKSPNDVYTEFPAYESIWLRFKDKYDKIESDPITCCICEKSMEKISNTHLQLHGITMDEYKQQFPMALTINSRLSKLHSEYTTESNASRIWTFRSKAEHEIEAFVRSLGIDVIVNDKHLGIELDIYIPTYNIAIEYDGLRWHSEFFGKKDKHYHASKTQKCNVAGIHLIHIFEDEWTSNSDLVKNKLMHVLGKTTTKIYARKCNIRLIDAKQSIEFCNQYHIQRTGKAYLHVGLFHEGELVACMQISKLRKALNQQNIHGHVEISRYCTKYAIIGGFGKIMKSLQLFDVSIRTVISYADKRWTHHMNNVYEKSGFRLIKDNAPNYWYINGSRRLHRYNFTKSRIVQLGGNPNLSEIENMIRMGYDRIWDCGTLKYIFEF